MHLQNKVRSMAGTASATFPSCVRCYHIYKDAWNPTIGDELDCLRDCANVIGNAVSVIDPLTKAIVGHLPKKISKVCSLFLHRGGTVRCEVTGGRNYSCDLPLLRSSRIEQNLWQSKF